MFEFIARALFLRLNPTQRIILEELLKFEGTASQFVRKLSEKGFPESTLWTNLRKLKKLGIVSFGDGRPLELEPVLKEFLRNCKKS